MIHLVSKSGNKHTRMLQQAHMQYIVNAVSIKHFFSVSPVFLIQLLSSDLYNFLKPSVVIRIPSILDAFYPQKAHSHFQSMSISQYILGPAPDELFET